VVFSKQHLLLLLRYTVAPGAFSGDAYMPPEPACLLGCAAAAASPLRAPAAWSLPVEQAAPGKALHWHINFAVTQISSSQTIKSLKLFNMAPCTAGSRAHQLLQECIQCWETSMPSMPGRESRSCCIETSPFLPPSSGKPTRQYCLAVACQHMYSCQHMHSCL
jgi:hypothetical protein